MIGVEGCEAGEVSTVEVDAEEVAEVGIFVRVHAAGEEVNVTVFRIDTGYGADGPFACGDLVFHLSGSAVVEVEMV